MKGTEAITNTIDKMRMDLKNVIDDAEVLLKTTREAPRTTFEEAKAKFEKTLNNAKGEALELEHEVTGKVREAAHASDVYVRDHAWSLAGAGATLGLLIGLLAGRKPRGQEREDH